MSYFIPNFKKTEPTHTRVLEWRQVREKLRRFEHMCSNLVLSMMQRLVMRAVGGLETGVRRVFREAATYTRKQRQDFLRMREEIVSQPYTQGILDRLEYSSHQDSITDDMELLALQASSFSELLSNSNLGEARWLTLKPCLHGTTILEPVLELAPCKHN